MQQIFENIPNVKILDINHLLSHNGIYSKFQEDNMRLYYDSDHLTAYAEEYIYTKIKKDNTFKWLIELVKVNNYLTFANFYDY